MSSSAGVAAEQAARTAGKTFFVLPANGLDEDLRHRPQQIPAGQLVGCDSVQDYCTLVLAGDADAADDSAASADAAAAAAATAATASSSVVRLASSTGSGRGRGLVATEALHTDTHLFAERGLVVLQSKNEKVENAIEFAFAVERMADAPMGVLLDLCNAFDEEEIEVIDAAVAAEHEALRPPTQRRLSAVLLNKLVGIYCSNAMALSSSAACGMFPLMAMANHSCDPNTEFSSRDGGQYIRAFARREVKEGEELMQSYLSEEDLEKGVEERQELLEEGFGFTCMCVRCVLETIQLNENGSGNSSDDDDGAAVDSGDDDGDDGGSRGSEGDAEADEPSSSASSTRGGKRQRTKE